MSMVDVSLDFSPFFSDQLYEHSSSSLFSVCGGSAVSGVAADGVVLRRSSLPPKEDVFDSCGGVGVNLFLGCRDPSDPTTKGRTFPIELYFSVFLLFVASRFSGVVGYGGIYDNLRSC